MALLLEASGRHDTVYQLTDLDGDGMREAIRDALPAENTQNEVFFYYSGHGEQLGSEFYYCGVGFDSERPNETGLSHRQLHDLVRAVSPTLFVNVIDACYSGALLVKADQLTLPVHKDGFRHVLQFSSSMDSQTSRAGDPLSAFTRAFLEASIRKREGAVYYSDVANRLRDEFLGNDDQTPFFISQGTGREILADDASKLAPLHQALAARWSMRGGGAMEQVGEVGVPAVSGSALSLKDLLVAADTRIAGPQEAKQLIDMLFDGVLARLQGEEFAEYFDLTSTAHPDFQEDTAEDLILKVLSREPRPDEMVTAQIKRVRARRPHTFAYNALAFLTPDEWTEEKYLRLNCTLERAQLRVTLTPKFKALQQLVLVLSCAPSLERCYIFETTTRHSRYNWESFDADGREVVGRWYKLGWHGSPDGVVEQIVDAFEGAVRKHLDGVEERLKET